MLKIQYVDKEIPLSTRDSGNQNFIKLRNSGGSPLRAFHLLQKFFSCVRNIRKLWYNYASYMCRKLRHLKEDV